MATEGGGSQCSPETWHQSQGEALGARAASSACPQVTAGSCQSCTGGFFGDLSKLVIDPGPWGWSWSGTRRGRVSAALREQLERGSRSAFEHQTGSRLG